MADKIKGITIEIGGDTTKLKKALKEVDNELRQNQNSLKDINNLLKMDPGNVTLLEQKYKILGETIDGAKSKLQTLNEAQEQLANAGKAGTDEYDALQREIAETEQKIKSLTQEYKDFGSVAAQQVAAVGDKMEDLGGKMESAGQKLMPVTASLTAVGTVGVSKFAEVDKTMTLTNKTMNNSAEQAKLLSDAMESAAMNSTFGMNDAAQAALNFARAGLTAEQAAAAIAPAMNLAAGEGGNLDTVSAGLVATINGFGDSFNETEHYADVFAAACNNSALDVDSLANSMSIAAPIFKTAGKSVEDASLYLGIMANAGLDAYTAANALKTGMARLADPTKDAKEAMEEYGISMDQIWNEDGSMKDMVSIQNELNQSFSGLSEQEQMAAASAIFGKNQMAAWIALIGTSPDKVQELSDSLSTCKETTDEMATAMMSGFGGSLESLKSSVDVAATSLGEALAPTISEVAEGIKGAVDWFNSLDEEQQQLIAKVGLVVASLGPLLVVGGKITSGIGTVLGIVPKLVGAFGSIGGAIGSVGGAAGSAASSLSTISGAAGSVAGPAASAGTAIGGLAKNALGFIALGAGILLAAAGVALLAQAAIALADAGPEAGFALLALVGVLALLAAGAAALGPALAAGAVGLIAFGGAIALIGIGILAATAGIALLATQLPTISEYGGSAATAIIQLGSALTVFAVGVVAAAGGAVIFGGALVVVAGGAVILAGAGVALTASLVALTVAILAITVAIIAMAGGVGLLAAAVLALAVAITAASLAVIGAFDSARDGATDALNTVKNTFKSVFDGIKTYMSGVIKWLKGIFDFQWELPKIKLPHFSITGSFSLDPPSIPSFGVEWYKKAMDNGMILNSPTIFGAANGRLLGAGEAGPEVVVGADSLQSMITNAVNGAMGGDITIPVYIGNRRVETVVVNAQSRHDYKSGGR